MNIRYRSRISTTSKGKDRKKSTVSKASRNSVSSAGGLANSRLSDHSELPCEDDAHCKSRESWGGGFTVNWEVWDRGRVFTSITLLTVDALTNLTSDLSTTISKHGSQCILIVLYRVTVPSCTVHDSYPLRMVLQLLYHNRII